MIDSEIKLTTEQEKEVRVALCSEEYCLRCEASVLKPEERFIGTFYNHTKKHLYLHCFVLCKTCYKDKRGTIRWWRDLEDWVCLAYFKDRSYYTVTVR